MIIACQCLNVLIESVAAAAADDDKNIQFVDKYKFLDEITFKKRIHPLDDAVIKIQVPELMYIRYVHEEVSGTNAERKWKVFECLNCSAVAYGVFEEQNILLYNEKFVTTHDDINVIKGSDLYSPAFKIVINRDLLKLNVFGYRRSDTIMTYVMALKDRYQKMLVEEMKASEKRISDYREQQQSLFKTFQERTEQEYNAIVRKISNAPDDNTNSGGVLSPKTTHFDTPPTTPDSAPIESSPPFKQQKTIWPTITNTTAANNTKSMNDPKKQVPLTWVPVQPAKSQNDIQSADADCLFDLEGLEQEMSFNSDGGSYQHMDDYDDIDDDEADDIIINPIRQYTKQASLNMARSLPISMPINDASRGIDLDIDDEDKTEDNVDIAASIKALAKSVHGDTVFGDLPRPRFSTQI